VTEPALPLDPIAEARRQWEAQGWDDAAPGMEAVTSVMRAHQIMLGRIDEQLRDLDLTFARYEVLMLLHFSSRGSLPLKVIGSRLQVHPTSVTSAIDRLEDQGLVRRDPHPTDRRTKLAVLTGAGQQRALEAPSRLNATVFAEPGMSQNQVDQLVRVLRALRRDAGDF
jgi:DNA-binding MarR family transcriptional regulator